MNVLALTVLILNIFISISILLQEDTIKNSSLAFGKSPFFNNSLEKITFLIIMIQFLFLLIEIKFDIL